MALKDAEKKPLEAGQLRELTVEDLSVYLSARE